MLAATYDLAPTTWHLRPGTYDLAGDMNRQSATIAGTADFLNSYSYNADQQLTAVTQQGVNGGNVVSPKEIDYAYNALGQFTSIVDHNTLSGPRTDVLTGAFGYDGDSRLTSLAYTSDAGANTIDSFGYTYNAGSLVTSFSSIDGTASYGYDPTNQLTSVSYTTASGGHQPANESYSYTANGNRDSTGYTTGSDNLMTSDGTFDYQHDADGNTTVRTRISNAYASDYRTTYTWDYRNRLTDVEYYDNNGVLTKHVHFVYDIFNNLIGEEDDDTGDGSYDQEQWYVNEGGQPALVFNASGALIERNLIAPNPAGVEAVMAQGTVASLTSGDVVTWAADDKLGTPHDIVSNSGTLLNHIVDNAVGETAYQSDPSVTWWPGFGGGHDDVAANLILNGLRWYDPSTGKWLSQDPINFRGHDADLTRYTGNDPTNAIDPSGEITWGQAGAMAVTPVWVWPLILTWNEQSQKVTAAQKAQMQAMTKQSLGMQQAMNKASNQSGDLLDAYAYWYQSKFGQVGMIASYGTAGLVVGAATTAAVVVSAPIAASATAIILTGMGVSAATATTVSTAAVTFTLFAGAVGGTLNAAASTYQAYNTGNWNQLAFNIGSLAGGGIVGTMGGGQYLATGLMGKPSGAPQTWNPISIWAYEWKNAYIPGMGPPGLTWWSSAPTPASGGFAAAVFSGIGMPTDIPSDL